MKRFMISQSEPVVAGCRRNEYTGRKDWSFGVVTMKEVGAYEAKTHLSELLNDVALGEIVIITRRGKPVAKIVPFESETENFEEIKERLYNLRNQVVEDKMPLRDMIEEGRRF